jgi:hypothetical protein
MPSSSTTSPSGFGELLPCSLGFFEEPHLISTVTTVSPEEERKEEPENSIPFFLK